MKLHKKVLSVAIWHLVSVMMAIFLSGCSSAARAQTPSGIDLNGPTFKWTSLGLTGYNYTNRYIDTFTVDGQGGGNIYVSSPASGGGGTACCVHYLPGVRNATVKVRWQSGACYYHVHSRISDEVFDNLYSFYKEKEVPVIENFKQEPKYMEVHFYPDDSVQVTVTETASLPRLSLNKDRNDRAKFPRCQNDKKPEE